jgi:hypothetical protein
MIGNIPLCHFFLDIGDSVSYTIIMLKLPIEIAQDVGCDSSFIRRINYGQRFPSARLALKIIEAMKKRGVNLKFSDLRPDLPELEVNHG